MTRRPDWQLFLELFRVAVLLLLVVVVPILVVWTSH